MKKVVVFIFLLLFVFVKPASAATSTPSLSDEVYADLALRGYLDNVSLSYFNQSKNESVGIGDTKHWIPASTVKLFAALYAYKKINDGSLNLDDSVTVDAKNVALTESVQDGLPNIEQGDYVSTDRLIRQMITQSDNTAFNTLVDVLDRKEITSYIQSIGLTHSTVGSKLNLDTSQTQYEFDAKGYGINTTTAQDYTLAYELILQNKIPGASALLTILEQQKINYMIPLLLPKDAVIAHKHGDLDPLYHDGGIIFAPNSKPYVISIFSNAGDPNLVAHLSQLIYTRDPKLVGAALQTTSPNSGISYPIDPLVAAGTLPASNVLAAQTPALQTQPITAADLGITANDLSLAKPLELPKIAIPADSPFHFLVSVSQSLKKASAFSVKDKTGVDTQSVLIKVAEAKDLYKRNKTAQANSLIQNIQQEMTSIAKTPGVQNNAAAQIALQTVSESRFQLLGDNLKSAKSDGQRNQIIKDIGQQAKTTVKEVQPSLPLASNATNVTQKPLIGNVVAKNDSAIIVKTAGGQQITVPTDSNITVRTKELPQPVVAPATSASESATQTPTTTSLSKVEVGTTVALVGSSVGNVFTPTFVLTNVAKELAAPGPVTVVKINPDSKTMVISENGVPVQVNVSNKTSIRGADTSIGLNQIKEGDIVIVHGEPLKPIAPKSAPQTTPSSSPTPTQGSSNPTGAQNTNQPTTSVSPSSQTSPAPQSGQSTTTTQTPAPSRAGQTAPTSTLQNNAIPITGAQKNQTQTAPQTPKTAAPVRPKVIQSTTIQVVEKKQNVGVPATKPAPAPEAPKSQPQPPKSAPPAATTAPSDKAEEKKK